MSIDVSAVVPLYNAKNYVKLTVDSILDQTLKNIEVVIVDDCSTDGSLELCRELYAHDERVKIVQQPQNMGVGAARNAGIRSASGDYIAFVDSDDELLPDALASMFDTAHKHNADVLHNTAIIFPIPHGDGEMPLQLLNGNVEYFPHREGSIRYTELTLLNDDLSSRFEKWLARQISWSVCNKMFRRKFLTDNSIFFSDMKLAEDMVFCFECLFKAKNYVILPGGGYVYRIVGTSLSRGKKSSAHIIKALKSQILGVYTLGRILSEIPFFAENPEKARVVVETVLGDLEAAYIRPAYQELGYEALRSDEVLSEFFREQFGEKAPYVEFMFHDLHRRYEPVIDYFALLGNMETYRTVVKEMQKKEQNS